MQLDGRHVLMLNPGFNEMGEALDSQNHPFGMLRAAAWLKSMGHTVDMIDCGLPPRVDQSSDRLKERHHGKPVKMLPCGHWQGEGIWKTQMYYGQPMTAIRNAMAQQRPDEIWVGSGLTYHWETTAELVQIAREMFPSTRIRVGGIYPTLCPDHARRVCDGAEVWAGEIPEAREFWPDYSVYPHTVPFRTVKWSTGCTVAKACAFCSVKALEPKFAWRNGASFEDYVERALHEGVRHIRIWASQLLQPPKAFMDLMERLYRLQLKHGIPFQLYASEGVQPSLFTPAMANAMVRAGFHTINIPMESIEPETLKQFNKPSGLDDYYRAVQIAKEAGFSFIGTFIMVGTPQQSLEEIVHAIVDCWYRRISPTIMKYTIIPGSQDWEDHAWVHEGKDLHHLHPSLWPGAREDLTVRELEELTYIARIGYAAWSRLPQEKVAHFQGSGRRTASRVDRLFVKWCRIYGLVKNGRYRDLDVATPHEPPSGRHRTTLRDSAWTSGQHVALTL